MIRKSHLIICLVAAFLSFGSSVHAGVINLPPAMYSMGTSDYYVGDGSRLRPAPLYQDHTYSESRSVKQLDDGRVAIGRATVEAKIEQVPTVKASMSHDGGPWMGIATEPIANGYEHFDNYMVPTKAYSELTYYYSIMGPSSLQIPVFVDYVLEVMSSGTVYNESYGMNAGVRSLASISMVGISDAISINYGDGGKSLQKKGTLQGYITANNISSISIRANIESYNSYNRYRGVMEGYAFADPVIRIDPSFADANLYTVVLSDGVGNSWTAPPAPTPEPGTALLMGVGLLVVGAVARRKRLHA